MMDFRIGYPKEDIINHLKQIHGEQAGLGNWVLTDLLDLHHFDHLNKDGLEHEERDWSYEKPGAKEEEPSIFTNREKDLIGYIVFDVLAMSRLGYFEGVEWKDDQVELLIKKFPVTVRAVIDKLREEDSSKG